jgi:hypothetical protein
MIDIIGSSTSKIVRGTGEEAPYTTAMIAQ